MIKKIKKSDNCPYIRQKDAHLHVHGLSERQQVHISDKIHGTLCCHFSVCILGCCYESILNIFFYRIDEVVDTDNDWGGGYFHRPTDREQEPRFNFNVPLSRTQEFPRQHFDLMRASVESLPNIRTSHDPDSDLHSNPSCHGSRDQLDSDYHSNTEEPSSKKADFHGNVYPMEDHLEGTSQVQNKKKKGQRKGQKETQNNTKPVASIGKKVGQGELDGSNLSTKDRENILRKSIEDFAKLKQEALSIQGNEQFYDVHGTQGGGQGDHYQGQGHQFHGPHNWQRGSNQSAAEHPYDESNPAHHHHMGQMQGQGHFYPEYQGHGHATSQSQEHTHQEYHQHYPDHHHHFQNIYEGRPYQTIGEREETEGGNVGQDDHYYQYQDQYGYYQNNVTPSDRGFISHATDLTDAHHIPSYSTPNEYHQSHPNVQNQRENQSHPNENQNFNRRVPNEATKEAVQEHNSRNLVSPRQSREGFPEGYKVSYQMGQEDKGGKKDRNEEKRQTDKSKEKMEKEFMQQGKLLNAHLCRLRHRQLQISFLFSCLRKP